MWLSLVDVADLLSSPVCPSTLCDPPAGEARDQPAFLAVPQKQAELPGDPDENIRGLESAAPTALSEHFIIRAGVHSRHLVKVSIVMVN